MRPVRGEGFLARTAHSRLNSHRQCMASGVGVGVELELVRFASCKWFACWKTSVWDDGRVQSIGKQVCGMIAECNALENKASKLWLAVGAAAEQRDIKNG